MSQRRKDIMTNRSTGGNICFQQRDVAFDWKIENFSSLPDTVYYCYFSFPLYFCGRTWNLLLFPNGARSNKSEGYVGLFLLLKDSGPPLDVRYSGGIKTANGQVEIWYKDSDIFEVGLGQGRANCLLRTELLRRKDELIPNDVLTLTVTLQVGKELTSKNGTKNASVQTAVELQATDVSVQTGVEDNAEEGPSEKTGSEKVLQDIAKIWMSGEDSDVLIKVRDVVFKAHKTILAARTPALGAMFRHETTEKASGEATIDDCEPAVFEQLLHFIYTGAPRVLTAENASALYVVADKYLLSEVKALCVRCMQDTLCLDNFCSTVTLSLMHREQELLGMAIDFFSENMLRILKTVEWQMFLREHATWANEILIRSSELNEARIKKDKEDDDLSHA